CALRRVVYCFFFFSSRRRHTRFSRDWSSDVCSSDLVKERLDALTGGLLAALVLLLAGRLLGDVDGGGPAGVEVVELRARAGEGRGGVVHTPSLVVGCLPLDA